MRQKFHIATFHPLELKHRFVNVNGELTNITNFFIHRLQDRSLKLQLPLPPHRKTVHDFMFVTNGEVRRTFGTNEIVLKAGDVIKIPKLQISSTISYSKDVEGFYCHFSDAFFSDTNWQELWNDITVVSCTLNEDVRPLMITLLNRIVELYEYSLDDPKNHSYDRLIQTHLTSVLSEALIQMKQLVTRNEKRKLTLKFIELSHLRYKDHLKLSEYAALLCVSPNHLNKTVKLDTGKTCSQYIEDLIVLEAKVLLLQSKEGISEIAHLLGFEDATYFSRFFKKAVNCSPSSYRKMID